MMSTSHTRKEVLICGWCRENYKSDKRSVPFDLIRLLATFSCNCVQWMIGSKDLDSIQKGSYIQGPSVMVDGILFNLSLDGAHLQENATQFDVKLDKSSLLKTTLNITFIITTKSITIHDQCFKNQFKYSFNSGQNEKRTLFITDALKANKYDAVDIEYSFEIVRINYYKMDIHSCLKWNLKEQELKVLNEGIFCLGDEYNNLCFLVWSGLNDTKELWIEPKSFLKGIESIEINYVLNIKWTESDGDQINHSNLQVIGSRRLIARNGEYIYEWNKTGHGVYTKLSIVMQITVSKINDTDVLDNDKWKEYGFV